MFPCIRMEARGATKNSSWGRAAFVLMTVFCGRKKSCDSNDSHLIISSENNNDIKPLHKVLLAASAPQFFHNKRVFENTKASKLHLVKELSTPGPTSVAGILEQNRKSAILPAIAKA